MQMERLTLNLFLPTARKIDQELVLSFLILEAKRANITSRKSSNLLEVTSKASMVGVSLTLNLIKDLSPHLARAVSQKKRDL